MDTLLLTIPDTGDPGWDLTLDVHGNIALASSKDPTGAYGQAQDAASAIKTFQGECYYDTTLGLPWWLTILGRIPPLALFKSILVNAAKTVPGVVSAQVFVNFFAGRTFNGQVQIRNTNSTTSPVVGF